MFSLDYLREMCQLAYSFTKHSNLDWASHFDFSSISDVNDDDDDQEDIAQESGLLNTDTQLSPSISIFPGDKLSAPSPNSPDCQSNMTSLQDTRKRPLSEMAVDEEENIEGCYDKEYEEFSPTEKLQKIRLSSPTLDTGHESNKPASADEEAEECDWSFEVTSHPFIGLRVRYQIESAIDTSNLEDTGSKLRLQRLIDRYAWYEDGTVVGYLGPTEADPEALWRILLDDKDENPSEVMIEESSKASAPSGTSHPTIYLRLREDSKTFLNVWSKVKSNQNRDSSVRFEDMEEVEVMSALKLASVGGKTLTGK
jgi:hypothetical protein